MADGCHDVRQPLMSVPRKHEPVMIFVGILAVIYLAVGLAVDVNQRSLIYFPSHDTVETPLRPWVVDGKVLGYCRPVAEPGTVWLMTHGNAGQASHREYVLARMSDEDALYVLEYPGYGLREGRPTKDSMDGAAAEAYQALRKQFPHAPLGLLGESIGSGPASFLASSPQPPEKIVLVVPFDTFAAVAAEHMPLFPVRAMVKDNWDNMAALRNYKGPVVIYGAIDDQVIPIENAKRLAASLPSAKFICIEGGHNDWSNSPLVRIQR
jgi:pimeloyl-ACP methyl ester carboxylesterase